MGGGRATTQRCLHLQLTCGASGWPGSVPAASPCNSGEGLGCRWGWALPFQPPCPREREGTGRSEPAEGSCEGSKWCSQSGPPGAMGMMGAVAPCLHPGVDQSSTSLRPAGMSPNPEVFPHLAHPGLPVCRDWSQALPAWPTVVQASRPCQPASACGGSPRGTVRTCAEASISSSLRRSSTCCMSSCRARTVLATWASSSASSPWASSGAFPASRSPPASQTSVGHKDGCCSEAAGQAHSARGSAAGPDRAGQAEHCLTLPEDPQSWHGPLCTLSPNGSHQVPAPHRGLPTCCRLCPHRSAPGRAGSPQPSSPPPPPPAGAGPVPGDMGHHVPPAQWWWQWVTAGPPMHRVQQCTWVTLLHPVKAGRQTPGRMPCLHSCLPARPLGSVEAPNQPGCSPANTRITPATSRRRAGARCQPPRVPASRGDGPARLYRPRYKLTPKVKQPGRVCGNTNGGKISMRRVGCAQVRWRHHPCRPMGEGGNATQEQKAPRDVSWESRRGCQEAPCPLSAAARPRAWLSSNAGSSGRWH